MLGTLLSMPFGPSFPEPVRNVFALGWIFGLVGCRVASSHAPVALAGAWPFAAFALAMAVSIALSEFRDVSLARASHVPVGLLFFVAIQELCASAPAARRLIFALAGGVGAIGVDVIVQASTGTSLLGLVPLETSRPRGSLPLPNDLALVASLLPFALALVEPRKLATSALGLAAAALGVAGILLSQSRNALLGAGVALGVSTLLRAPRRVAVALAAVALLAPALLVLAAPSTALGGLDRLSNFEQDGRVGIWSVAWRMFREDPFLGKGAFSFGEFYVRTIHEVPLPDGYEPERRRIPWAHSLYLEQMSEQGGLGLAVFLAVLSTSWISCWRARASGALPAASEDAKSPGRLRLAEAALASLAAFAVMGLFDLTFQKDWVLLIFSLLSALAGSLARLSRAGGAPGAR